VESRHVPDREARFVDALGRIRVPRAAAVSILAPGLYTASLEKRTGVAHTVLMAEGRAATLGGEEVGLHRSSGC
jgi:hypothetical protein